MTVLAVMLGGFVGAPSRLLLDRFVADRVVSSFPSGTLLVNLSGSFVLGLLTGVGLSAAVPPTVSALVGAGLCGSFTTFSTWSFETFTLAEDGEYAKAATNVGASLLAGLLAAGAGIALGSLFG